MGRGALVAIALLAGCHGRGAGAPVQPPETGRFPHAVHTETACTDCHPIDRVLAGVAARPGTDDHAPCDRARCHQQAFEGPPGRLCEICHDRVAVGGETRPAEFPPRTGRRALAAEFSHAEHLDYAAMERAVGFHVSCGDCHQTPSGSLTPPSHSVCGRCHSPEAAPENAPRLDQCGQCHKERANAPTRARRLIVGDLRFSHDNHQVDRRGASIRCTTCHARTALVTRTGEHEPPLTRECVGCHDNPSRTPETLAMRECETCHAEKASTIGALPPRSHLPATERPADHTLAFRADHSRDVERDGARCAKCHTFLSGSDRAICDDCHQVMEPRSHTVTWREYDHGPEAAVRSDGCAVCHGGDYCTACHQVVPRSHFPLLEFGQAGGHSIQAKLNPRPCVACHSIETFCRRCHHAERR